LQQFLESQQQRFGGQPQTQNQSNSSISFESSGGFDDDDNDSDQEEEVDDHLESSRVLSDTERSRYRRSLKISPIKPKKVSGISIKIYGIWALKFTLKKYLYFFQSIFKFVYWLAHTEIQLKL
jgi:hypothetical protein